MRQCCRCRESKPVSDFPTRNLPSGNKGLRSECRLCYNQYHRTRMARPDVRIKYAFARRKHLASYVQWFDSFKEKPCMDCGCRFPTHVMDFDHRDPKEKRYHMASLRRALPSRKRALIEMEKCDLVCANCHRVRTHKRRLSRGVVTE